MFHQGDRGDELYIIARGNVKIVAQSMGEGLVVYGSQELIAGITKDKDLVDLDIAELGPGQWFGEIAIMANMPRIASAYVVNSAILLSLKRGLSFLSISLFSRRLTLY